MKKLFVGVSMVAVLFLSGCNLNTGTTAPSAVSHDDESAMTDNPIQVFDQQQFDVALADGKTVFLDFYAPWCPTCRANEPIVDAAFNGTDVVAFRVDYDTAKDLRKKYSVTSQSTYIVFKNGQELKRYLGSLTASKIDELIGN